MADCIHCEKPIDDNEFKICEICGVAICGTCLNYRDTTGTVKDGKYRCCTCKDIPDAECEEFVEKITATLESTHGTPDTEEILEIIDREETLDEEHEEEEKSIKRVNDWDY